MHKKPAEVKEVWQPAELRERIEKPLISVVGEIRAAFDALELAAIKGKLPPQGITVMVKMTLRAVGVIQEFRDRIQAKVRAADEGRIFAMEEHKQRQAKYRKEDADQIPPEKKRKIGRPKKSSD
jgi:hypothetical protein